MNRQIKKAITAFTLLVTATFAGQASADTYEHLDLLALLLDRQAKEVVTEAREHYRHTPEYRHLLNDAKSLSRSATHLHNVAHRHGTLAHMSVDVTELDATFHHLEEVFDRIEHNAAYGHGHIHGGTAHVKRLLKSIEDGIHHMQEDIEQLRTPVYHTNRVYRSNRVYYPQREVYTPRTYNGHNNHGHNSHGHNAHGHNSGRSFSIGGGNSRVTFRF